VPIAAPVGFLPGVLRTDRAAHPTLVAIRKNLPQPNPNTPAVRAALDQHHHHYPNLNDD